MLSPSSGTSALISKVTRTKGYFDWYIGTKQLVLYLIRENVLKTDRILVVGAGNSSEITRDDGAANREGVYRPAKLRHIKGLCG